MPSLRLPLKARTKKSWLYLRLNIYSRVPWWCVFPTRIRQPAVRRHERRPHDHRPAQLHLPGGQRNGVSCVQKCTFEESQCSDSRGYKRNFADFVLCCIRRTAQGGVGDRGKQRAYDKQPHKGCRSHSGERPGAEYSSSEARARITRPRRAAARNYSSNFIVIIPKYPSGHGRLYQPACFYATFMLLKAKWNSIKNDLGWKCNTGIFCGCGSRMYWSKQMTATPSCC